MGVLARVLERCRSHPTGPANLSLTPCLSAVRSPDYEARDVPLLKLGGETTALRIKFIRRKFT